MKEKTIIRIHRIIELVDKGNIYVIVGIATLLISPFLAIPELWKFIIRKVKGEVYDSSSGEWTTKEKLELKLQKQKIENREIPLVSKKHVEPQRNERFYFFDKRKLIIPYDKLVYVETEYNETLHSFFKDNAEWLATWQKWHGWDIINVDYDDIKEGMFYPQDFHVFRHGFLWHSNFSSFDKESDLLGSIHYYYDIDLDSDIPIKEQMEQFMRKIYENVDWA